MPDLTIPLITTAVFVGGSWLIINAGRHYDDAIQHTLKVFALALGLLVLAGVTTKLRAALGIGRMMHRVEAHSRVAPTGAERTKPTAKSAP